MNSTMKYKGYTTKVVYSQEDKALIGRLEGIGDIVLFDAQSIPEFEQAFHESVDDYLAACEAAGKEPQKAFSGSFNVRVSPELHSSISAAAIERGETLNAYVEKALQASLRKIKLYDEFNKPSWNLPAPSNEKQENLSVA